MNPDASELGFHYRFVPGAPDGGGVTLLLLHGTGGSENDLIPLGQTLAPGAALLSPRGRVLENGMPRYFRRLAEGVFDQKDLQLQTAAMAQFIEASSQKYALAKGRIVAVGYSNGANIASSVLFTRPDLLRTAVLFRPMAPFDPTSPPALGEVKVLVCAGKRDPIVAPAETNRLIGILEKGGATVTVNWHAGGHELGQDDLHAATAWIAGWRAAQPTRSRTRSGSTA